MLATASFGAACMAFSSPWIINRYCIVLLLEAGAAPMPRSLQRRLNARCFDRGPRKMRRNGSGRLAPILKSTRRPGSAIAFWVDTPLSGGGCHMENRRLTSARPRNIESASVQNIREGNGHERDGATETQNIAVIQ